MGGITQSIAVLNCPMAQAVSSLCFLRSACLAMVVTYVCSVQCGLHVINVFCGGKCRSIWVGPNRPESWNLWVVHVPGVGATPGIQWSQWSYGAWCPFEQRTSCTPSRCFRLFHPFESQARTGFCPGGICNLFYRWTWVCRGPARCNTVLRGPAPVQTCIDPLHFHT